MTDKECVEILKSFKNDVYKLLNSDAIAAIQHAITALEDGEKDYKDMRMFQQKFIDADQELRKLKEKPQFTVEGVETFLQKEFSEEGKYITRSQLIAGWSDIEKLAKAIVEKYG